MISTVSDSQDEILKNIIKLYVPRGKFDVDMTYSTGGFYQNGVPEPTHAFDINPQCDDVVEADCRNLPLDSASVQSIIFDPPFIHAAGKDSIMGNRFSDGRSQHALRALYMGALVEAYRVLKAKGVLIFKCQDIIESGRQVFNHCHIWMMANNLGFVDLDLFILLKKNSITGHNWSEEEQKHAHKGCSFFMVFEKGSRR